MISGLKRFLAAAAALCMATNVFAQSEKVIEKEISIKQAGTIEMAYKNGPLKLDRSVIEPPASAAYNESKSGPAYERKPKVTVLVNVTGAGNELELAVDKNISELSDYVDEIAVNANGIFCYIDPSDTADITDKASFKITDTDKVMDKYTQAASHRTVRKMLTVVFVVLALFLLIYSKFY